jgi:cysteine desulfurase / selenocysteine lyase
MNLDSRLTDFRNLVVGLNVQCPLANGTYATFVNFDNAATTPSFWSVLKSINDFSSIYSSVHRGKGYKSVLSSDAYEQGREIIKNFVKADKENDIVIYTKNATDSLNTLASILSEQKDGKDVIISTWMEHAANDLPWRDKFRVKYVQTDEYGRLSLNSLETKLKRYSGKIKLVTVTGASNVTGYLNPVYEIAKLAHKYGTKILVDGAQLIPHAPFDMKPFGCEEHIDYLAFSAHKMYAPFGTGVLIGPKETFKEGNPYCQGGSAISLVTHKRILWEEPPQKDEAGTPNLMGVMALVTAIKTLQSIGMDKVFAREKELYDYALKKIVLIPGIKLYSHPDKGETISIIPFNMEGVHHKLMAAILSYEAGISVRTGFFCAHPYSERLLGLSEKDMETYFKDAELPLPGIVRISFGLYNNYQEIDRLICALNTIASNKDYYVKKYENNKEVYRIKNDVK